MATGTYTQTNNQNAVYGENSAGVLSLQKKLNALGAGIAEDSKYGPQTLAAYNKYKSQLEANPADLHTAINGQQDSEIQTGQDGEVPTKGMKDVYGDAFAGLKDMLVGDTERPVAPKFGNLYGDLRNEYGLDTLEGQLNDLNNEERTIQESKRLSVATERDKPVAMNVIEGRVGEQERNFNTRLESVSIQKSGLADQLKSAYGAIDTIMKFKEMDYNAAKDDYDKQFSQNLQIFDTIQGYVDKKTDYARANLQIIYNSLKDGDTDFSKITPDMKAQFAKLEAQAGLPIGFYASFASAYPNGKPVSTTTREDNGKKYVDVVYIDKTTGRPKVLSTYVGQSRNESSGAEAFKLSATDKKSLLGANLSLSDIASLENDLRIYGFQSVLEGLSDPAQKSVLQSIFSGDEGP